MSSEIDEVYDAIESMRASLDELRQMSAEATAELAQAREESAAAAEQRAQQRRAGEHGPQWQVLQARIDLNQTTDFDIRTGVDKSPEARAVREAFSNNFAALRADFVAALTADENHDELSALQEQNARLQETMNGLADIVAASARYATGSDGPS